MLDDEFGHGRRTLGVIDGTLTQIALAIVLLMPTIITILTRPRQLTKQIDDLPGTGHMGAVLAPGPFFTLGFLSILIVASFQQSNGVMISLGADVRAATREGEFWRVASLVAPVFFAAIFLGLIFFASAFVWRLKRRSLTASLRAGLYALFGVASLVIVGEPLSILVGGRGGSNGVFEPVVAALVSGWIAFFHVRALTAPPEPIIARAGAALTTAAFCAAAISFIYVG